ncbi:hypothetical protein NKH18_09950 [Streptomyces sp. M10(2022)]
MVVGNAQGRVLGVEQFAGRGHDRLEHVPHIEVPVHGEQGCTHRSEARPGRWVMPAPYRRGYGSRIGLWAAWTWGAGPRSTPVDGPGRPSPPSG